MRMTRVLLGGELLVRYHVFRLFMVSWGYSHTSEELQVGRRATQR